MYGMYVIPYISMIYLSGALSQVWAWDHARPHNALHSPSIISFVPRLPNFHHSSHCTWWKVGCGSLGRRPTYARGVTIHIFWTERVTHSWACAQGNTVPQETLCQLLFGTDPRLFDSSRKDNQINALTLHIHTQCMSVLNACLSLVLNARLHVYRGCACDVISRQFLYISAYFCICTAIFERQWIGRLDSKAYSMSALQGMAHIMHRTSHDS